MLPGAGSIWLLKDSLLINWFTTEHEGTKIMALNAVKTEMPDQKMDSVDTDSRVTVLDLARMSDAPFKNRMETSPIFEPSEEEVQNASVSFAMRENR